MTQNGSAADSSGKDPRSQGYRPIQIAGGDTATPQCLERRARFFADHLPRPCRVLDCGCGAGEYVLHLRENFGLDVSGVEYEPSKVERARAHPELAARVEQGNLESLEKPASSFDAALLNEVLEHVPDEPAALREIQRVLKPGGTLIVCSPNRWFPFESHGCHWRRSGRRVPHWLPFVPWLPLGPAQRWFAFWARNYWPRELRALLEAAGFEVLKTSFFWPTFENISGRQPGLIRVTRPLLRGVSRVLERTPVLRRFGVSQVFVCRCLK